MTQDDYFRTGFSYNFEIIWLYNYYIVEYLNFL